MVRSRIPGGKTSGFFSRFGARSLLFAKFVPGLSTFAAPGAGMAGATRLKFWALDGVGALAWATMYAVIGATVGATVFERWAHEAEKVGAWVMGALAVAAVVFLASKIVRRVRFGPARSLDVLGKAPAARADPLP